MQKLKSQLLKAQQKKRWNGKKNQRYKVFEIKQQIQKIGKEDSIYVN